MEEIHNLKSCMWRNINETVSKPNLTESDVKCIGEAVDILKDLETIEAMKNYGGNESEYYPESFANGRGRSSYGNHPYYNSMTNNSMRRSPNTGRYVSMDGGVMAQLNAMYDNASNEHERKNLEKLMNFASNNLDNY